jgi:hypothetical protein
MLFEKSHSQTWLTRDAAFTRLERTGDQPKQRRLAASIPAKDSPPIARRYSESDSLENPCRAELDSSVRN